MMLRINPNGRYGFVKKSKRKKEGSKNNLSEHQKIITEHLLTYLFFSWFTQNEQSQFI